MKLTLGLREMADETLQFAQQFGVTHLKVNAADFMDEERRGPIRKDALAAAIERLKTFDLRIGVLLLPQEPGSQHWNIRLGRPERDAEIEDVQRSLATAGAAGIGVVEYVFNLAATYGYSGRGNTWGRGGAQVTHFDYELAKDDPAPDPSQEVGADEMWDRITYFLERVVPAAEAAEVRLACHPNDPPAPRLRGEDRVLGSFEGMKRLIEIVPSESNGLNFCQGTFAEMGIDVVEAIRYFGSRDRINHIHFRNVRGAVPVYDEVFIDDGDTDMVAAMRAYKEVGYSGTIMPDHTPRVIGDTPFGHRGRAFALGYIRALMQALDIEEG